MLLEPGSELLADDALYDRLHLRGDELLLRLAGELGVRHLDREHAGEPLARILAGKIHLLLLGEPALARVLVDDAGERGAEAGQVRAAVALRDVVGEEQHVLVVAVVPPQCHLDDDLLALTADHDRLADQRLLGAVEIAHEGRRTALIHHLLAPDIGVARVRQHDLGARVQEGELAQAVLERCEVELGLREGLGARQERHLGAALALGVADDAQRRHRHTVAELDQVLLAFAPDAALEPARQGIDHRHADAVQASRHLVGVLIELAAGMQLGEHDLGSRALGIVVVVGLDAGGDAAPVVAHGARAVRVQRDRAFLGVAGQDLVDGVVDDLVDHVMQTRPVIGVADVHAGPLAHGIEPFQHLDGFGAVLLGARAFFRGQSAHFRVVLGVVWPRISYTTKAAGAR